MFCSTVKEMLAWVPRYKMNALPTEVLMMLAASRRRVRSCKRGGAACPREWTSCAPAWTPTCPPPGRPSCAAVYWAGCALCSQTSGSPSPLQRSLPLARLSTLSGTGFASVRPGAAMLCSASRGQAAPHGSAGGCFSPVRGAVWCCAAQAAWRQPHSPDCACYDCALTISSGRMPRVFSVSAEEG